MSNYSELLKDPRWDAKRKEILQRDNYTCQSCRAEDCELQVHHSFYTGEDPWNYHNHLLISLCPECHLKEEEAKDCDSQRVEQFLSLAILRSDLNDLFWSIQQKISPLDEPDFTHPSITRARFKKIIEAIKSVDVNG